jgi:hypothetical protein
MMAASSLVFVVWAETSGRDIQNCGCLGKVELAFGDHLWFLAAMSLLSIGCRFADDAATTFS